MSVPADQLPQGQPQVFTEQDFANAENPPAGAPTPGSFDESEFGPDPNEKPVPTPPSLLSRAGKAIQSGYRDLVGDKTFSGTMSDLIASKSSSTKTEAPKKGEPVSPDAALEAQIQDKLHAGGALTAAEGTQFYKDILTHPGTTLKALGHGIALVGAKAERNIASADNAFGAQPMWVDANGNPVNSLTTADWEKQAKQDVETQKKALEEIGKEHPAIAQIGEAGPEAASQLAMAMAAGAVLPEAGEALSQYPEFIRAVKNPVVGSFLRKAYELVHGMPPGMATMALPSGVEGVNTYHEIKDNGGTVAQAVEGGVATAALSDFGGSMAVGMRGKIIPRVVKATLFGMGYSVGETAAINPFLPANMQQKNTAVGLGINGLMYGALAAMFGTSDLSPEAVHEMYDNLQNTAKNDPDPEARASASRQLAMANQFHASSGGMSSPALVAAAKAEQARKAVMDAQHGDLYGSNDAYTRAYDASDGQFKDEATRQQSAQRIAASETAANVGWTHFMKLRNIIDDGLKDYRAAGQMPDLLDHAKNVLSPEAYTDLQDFLGTGIEPDGDTGRASWLQTGASPQYAHDVVLKTLHGGKLPPEAQQVLDARRARQAQFAKLFPNVDPVTGEPLEPETATQPNQAPESAETPQKTAPKEAPSGASGNPPKPPPAAPMDTLRQYFSDNPYHRAPEVIGMAGMLPPDLQQRMAEWSVNHSPLEVESAYREAAATGQPPTEVVADETQRRTESAQAPAEQNEARHGSTQAETQPETQEGVAGHGGTEPAGHEGSAATAGEPGNVHGNAEGAAGNGPAEAVRIATQDLKDAQENLTELQQNGVVGSELDRAHEAVENARVNVHLAEAATARAAPVQAALADAGVAPEEASVGPKGNIRIAQDASPEAAQKALDIAASDTGATNTEYPAPTPEQAKAGNYRKGGITFESDEGDLRVKIENPDGSVRSGDWGSRPLKGVHYGYIPDTVSADGAPLDVLMTHDAHDPSRPIAFIRQHDTTTGKFDELKVVMGARSRNEALQAYWRQYPRDLHLKLTPNGAQDVVMMKRPKALAFIKSGSVDVPPHPVSGKPMLMLRQMVPVEFDSRSGNMSGTRDVLDKLGKKHNLKGLEEDSGVYRGEVPRSAVPDLQHALEKNNVELEVRSVAKGPARKLKVGQGVGGKVRRGDDSDRRPASGTAHGRTASKAPAKRSPPPKGIPFVKSDAPIFEEGVNGHIGKHPVSVVGIHYSPKEGLTELDPAEAGTGSAGGERRRFGMGNFGRSGDPMARVMSFYVKDSAAIPAKETVVGGSNKYEAVLNNMYDVAKDPDGILKHADENGYGINHDRIVEEIHDAGYDGTVSQAPGPGQHARVATVRGIKGKIPVKEITNQYEEAPAKKAAPELKRRRDRFEEAAKQAKDEAKKRTKVPMFVLRHMENERLQKASRVYFEMAPSPDFRDVYNEFDKLKLSTRKKISDAVNEEMGPDALSKEIFGDHAPVKEAMGGYLGKVNPSYHMDYPDTPIKDVLAHAKDLADGYNQQSVMVVSPDLPNKAPVVEIRFKGADDPDTLQKFWTELRKESNDSVVGFSQIDGGIAIMNTDIKPEAAQSWFDGIDKALTNISARNGVDYATTETQQGYDFVGGDYDRYKNSLYGGTVGNLPERRINSLQLHSYEAIRAATAKGMESDRVDAEGLVAPGSTGVQIRNDRFRAVARLTRDKPSPADVADGRRQLAQVARIYSAELRAHDEDGVALPDAKGGPTKLTRDQWMMVRTPNFLRWGGDWLRDPAHADVLLDRQTGEPKIFYHETDPRNEASILLQGFRTDTPRSRFNDIRVPEGTFFKERPTEIGVGGFKGFKTQLPMFLRMRNPLRVDNKDALIERLGEDVVKAHADFMDRVEKNQAEYNKAAMYARNHPDDYLAAHAASQFYDRINESYEGPSLDVQKAIRAELQAQGHDGVIIDKDTGGNGDLTVRTYIVLRPQDAKSAGVSTNTFSERPGAMFRGPFEGGKKAKLQNVTEHAQHLVDQFGPNKPELVVHESRAKATPEAQEALKQTLGDSDVTPPAMYLDGKLHVFADANASPAELESAVMHEMVHYGLRKVFGDDMDPLLDDIWKNAQNDESFARTLDSYRNAYKGRPDFQRNIAEEYVAHLAETQSNPSVWRKVVDWFRAWARKHGLVHDWTDDDIRHLIRSVYSDLKEGRTSIAGIPAARTTVDFQGATQTTAYRGAAHGDFIQDIDGNWRFKNDDIDAELTRSLVNGEPALNADPKEVTAQGVRDLAALAGEERSVLTLPSSVPRRVMAESMVPYATYDGMHVVRPETSESPMYALRNSVQADPETQSIIDQTIEYDHSPASPWEWMQSRLRNFHFRNLANDSKSYWLDAGAYVDLMERKLNKGLLYDAVTSPYKQYWLTRNIRQIAMAVMRHGVPMWTPKGYAFRPGTKGLMEIWAPMVQTADGKNLMELYGAYKVGVRAKRLLHEFNPDGTPKEKLLTEEKADKFIALAKKYPQFKTAFAEEQKFLKDLQDFAVERGAMDPKTAEAWQRNAYVPFRRIIDGMETPSDAERRGVSDKITSKRIKGAAYALKDPNEALVDNTIRMLDHIYNNDAKRRVMALGDLSGAVKRIPLNWAPSRVSVGDAMNAMRKAGIEVDRSNLDPEDMQKIMTIFSPVAPRDRNIESTVEGGKLVYWQVNDARLLKSIHDMRAINSALTDKFIKTLSAPASWVRWGVTMSPKFMVKIMFKDMLNTFAQTGTNPNMLKHMWLNASRIYNNDKFIDQLRLNGFNGNEYYKVDDIKDYVRSLGGKGDRNVVLNSVDKAYHAYRRAGWISEQLSRTRVAEHILERGGSMAEAAWQGQNTLNWQKHGYGIAAKLLMRSVPFLNAHLQGMVRIYDGMVGRDVTVNRGRAIMSFFIKSMALAIPSMVLEAKNYNNKDYQRLPDYIKDAYWNIYLGGRHFMLPKPFEWGAMAGTMPQRALRVATGQDSGHEFWRSVYDTLTNDVFTVPIPALVQEPLEQWANKDYRTGLPIETEAMQQQQPPDRYNGSTTLAAKQIGKLTGSSPVRLQHAVNGYFSSVGMFALQMMSGLMRATGNFPAKPEARGGSWLMEALEGPFGGAKASSETGNQYLSDFYDAQKIADQVVGSVRISVTRGQYGRAQELAEDNPLAFRGHHELQVISVQLSRLRKQQRIVESSKYLSAQQKRAQLDAINESQKQLLDRYEPFFRSILDGKKQIENEQ